jgi:hypothetical protein
MEQLPERPQQRRGAAIRNMAALFLLALSLSGCSATYVPISWNFGDKVQQLSRDDVTLAILFNHYDPDRTTLRVAGASFDEVMMPSEVKYHLGAYRQDSRIIYTNLYQKYSDIELRDLMVHEFSHHIWFTSMSAQQREAWGTHLANNPSPLQAMVRQVYHNSADFNAEDFAFTVEYAREIDIRELARLNIITPEQSNSIVAQLPERHHILPQLAVKSATAAESSGAVANKGTSQEP